MPTAQLAGLRKCPSVMATFVDFVSSEISNAYHAICGDTSKVSIYGDVILIIDNSNNGDYEVPPVIIPCDR